MRSMCAPIVRWAGWQAAAIPKNRERERERERDRQKGKAKGTEHQTILLVIG